MINSMIYFPEVVIEPFVHRYISLSINCNGLNTKVVYYVKAYLVFKS